MDLRDYYRMMAADISDEDMRKAAQFLSDHIGKAREVMMRLVTECGVAVGSNSGAAGYYICANDDERREVIAELRSRARQLTDRAFSQFNVNLPSPTTINRLQGGLF